MNFSLHLRGDYPTTDMKPRYNCDCCRLTRLSRELVESLQLYHTLMAEMPPSLPTPAMSYPGAGYGMGQPGFMPGTVMPGMPMPGMPG